MRAIRALLVLIPKLTNPRIRAGPDQLDAALERVNARRGESLRKLVD